MSLLKKLCAGALTVALATSFASCSDTTWVYKTEKTTINSGVYIGMLAYGCIDAINQISSTNSENSKSIWDQKVENVDTATYIKNSAKDTAISYLAINDKFKEFKLSLSEDDEKQIKESSKSMMSQFANFIDFEASGVSDDSFSEIYADYVRKAKIFDYYFAKGGIEEVKDKELKSYYYKNYEASKFIAIPLTDSEGQALDEKETKKLKKQAKEYQTKLKNGADIDKLIAEYNKKTNATTSDKANADKDDNLVVLSKDDTSATKIFEKLKKSKAGDVFYVEDTGNLFVGVAEDIEKYEAKYKEARASILNSYKSEDFNKLVEGWVKAVKLTTNTSAVSRYKPKNLVLKNQ